jgi:hypothetical protein
VLSVFLNVSVIAFVNCVINKILAGEGGRWLRKYFFGLNFGVAAQVVAFIFLKPFLALKISLIIHRFTQKCSLKLI